MSDLARRVYETAHLTGEFTLRSGQVSHEYFDKYRFESEPTLLRDIAEAVRTRTYKGDVIDFELPRAVEACKRGLLEPIDAASLPPGAANRARVRKKALTTHCASETLSPRSAAIVG